MQDDTSDMTDIKTVKKLSLLSLGNIIVDINF